MHVEDIKASNVHCLMLIMFLCGNINVKRWGLSFYSKPPKECQLQDNVYIVNFFLTIQIDYNLFLRLRTCRLDTHIQPATPIPNAFSSA